MECNDGKEQDLIEQPDGSFVMKISQKDAISIDHCERSILQTAYTTIRKAISKHLTEILKKEAHEKEHLGKVIANNSHFGVEIFTLKNADGFGF